MHKYLRWWIKKEIKHSGILLYKGCPSADYLDEGKLSEYGKTHIDKSCLCCNQDSDCKDITQWKCKNNKCQRINKWQSKD